MTSTPGDDVADLDPTDTVRAEHEDRPDLPGVSADDVDGTDVSGSDGGGLQAGGTGSADTGAAETGVSDADPDGSSLGDLDDVEQGAGAVEPTD